MTDLIATVCISLLIDSRIARRRKRCLKVDTLLTKLIPQQFLQWLITFLAFDTTIDPHQSVRTCSLAKVGSGTSPPSMKDRNRPCDPVASWSFRKTVSVNSHFCHRTGLFHPQAWIGDQMLNCTNHATSWTTLLNLLGDAPKSDLLVASHTPNSHGPIPLTGWDRLRWLPIITAFLISLFTTQRDHFSNSWSTEVSGICASRERICEQGNWDRGHLLFLKLTWPGALRNSYQCEQKIFHSIPVFAPILGATIRRQLR